MKLLFFGAPGATREVKVLIPSSRDQMTVHRTVIFIFRVAWRKKKKESPAEDPFFLAPLARLERTTFRLGGGPSILVRYRGMTNYILQDKYLPVKKSKWISADGKIDFPLYRMAYFVYNKLNCVNFTK